MRENIESNCVASSERFGVQYLSSGRFHKLSEVAWDVASSHRCGVQVIRLDMARRILCAMNLSTVVPSVYGITSQVDAVSRE